MARFVYTTALDNAFAIKGISLTVEAPDESAAWKEANAALSRLGFEPIDRVAPNVTREKAKAGR